MFIDVLGQASHTFKESADIFANKNVKKWPLS